MTKPRLSPPAGDRPLISVIMANYNCAAYLADAIGSVQKQTVRDIEIIVSDDASTDDSVGIVRKLQETDPRIRLLLSDSNCGPAAARNNALDVAKGQWIAIVDSDDLIQPQRFSALLQLIDRDDADIVADDVIEFHSDDGQPSRAMLRTWTEPTAIDILSYIRLNDFYGSGPHLGYLKPIFRASRLNDPNIRYDESLRIAEDFDLVLRLLHVGCKMLVYPVPFYFYRKHQHSSSHRLDCAALETCKAANLRFRNEITEPSSPLAKAIDARRRSIDTALAYEHLLDALKALHWGTALRIAFSSPKAALLLRLPIWVRVRRLAGKPPFWRTDKAFGPSGSITGAKISGRGGERLGRAANTSMAQSPFRETQAPNEPTAEDITAVTVCICTFRRASVLDAIKSIADQTVPAGVSVEILVIDNDDGPTAAKLIADYCTEAGLIVGYVHAPERNISIARNAALGAVNTAWLAFLDDDELAPSDWLSKLLSARVGANAIFGPCQAIYSPDTPSWISAGDYHSNLVPHGRRPIITGHSSNVLIDMEFVRKHHITFDLTLGRTGGEDTMFFYALYRRGAVLRYVEDAVVFDYVIPSRINFRWIALRRYRAGQVYARMFRNFDKPRYWRSVFSAPFKIGACLCLAIVFSLSRDRAMPSLMRGIFHLGMLSFVLGASIVEEYPSTGWTLSSYREVGARRLGGKSRPVSND